MENERNVEQEPEDFCLHKLDNKCSSPRGFLRRTARRGGGRAAPVPRVHLLVPQGEHLLHGGDPGAGEALAVLAHPDGLQPLGHRPEHGAVAAAGAGQADGDSEERKSRLVSGSRDGFLFGLVSSEYCCDCSYRGSKSAMVFNDSGLRSSLSKKLTMSEKRGRLDRSCCQHWSISW